MVLFLKRHILLFRLQKLYYSGQIMAVTIFANTKINLVINIFHFYHFHLASEMKTLKHCFKVDALQTSLHAQSVFKLVLLLNDHFGRKTTLETYGPLLHMRLLVDCSQRRRSIQSCFVVIYDFNRNKMRLLKD